MKRLTSLDPRTRSPGGRQVSTILYHIDSGRMALHETRTAKWYRLARVEKYETSEGQLSPVLELTLENIQFEREEFKELRSLYRALSSLRQTVVVFPTS